MWRLGLEVRVSASVSTDFLKRSTGQAGTGCTSQSGCRKRGVEFKGGSLQDTFGGFGSSEEHLAPCPPFGVATKYSTKRQPWQFWQFLRLWRFRKLNPPSRHPEPRVSGFEPRIHQFQSESLPTWSYSPSCDQSYPENPGTHQQF